MKRIKRCIKSHIKKLILINDYPKNIAYGFALGIFLATTPFIGCKVFIAIIITYFLKWNKVASIIGVFHVNGINGAAFYTLSYIVGRCALGYNNVIILPKQLNISSLVSCFLRNHEFFISLLVGGMIIGIPLSIAGYWLTINALRRWFPEKKVNCSTS